MISKMLLWMVKHAAWRGHKFGLWNSFKKGEDIESKWSLKH